MTVWALEVTVGRPVVFCITVAFILVPTVEMSGGGVHMFENGTSVVGNSLLALVPISQDLTIAGPAMEQPGPVLGPRLGHSQCCTCIIMRV